MLPLLHRLHNRLAQAKPPFWASLFPWMALLILFTIASIALVPGNGRGEGVRFTYAIFADGRRVPGWESKDISGATADIFFSANIWSTEVLGFRRWRCDVSANDRKGGPMPPAGMTQAEVDALRREGCAYLIAAARGNEWEQFVLHGGGEYVLLSEEIPGVELMAQGGGFGCGGGLRGHVGEAMHNMYRWLQYLGIGCGVIASLLSGLHHHARGRLQRRIARADKALCPKCEYPLPKVKAAICSECGIDVPAEVARCQLMLAGPVKS